MESLYPDQPGYLPVALGLAGRSCLVVGGGAVALRKVRGLLAYGGCVTVLAPDFREELVSLEQEGRITLERRAYGEGAAAGYGLVISAADPPEVNHQVFLDCREAGVWVNVVDDPDRCDFILPATLRQGPLTVSVGTQGKAPFLTRWIREELEALLPGHWGTVATLAGAFRKAVLAGHGEACEKRELFRRFLEVDWKTVLEEEGETRAEAILQDLLGERPPAD